MLRLSWFEWGCSGWIVWEVPFVNKSVIYTVPGYFGAVMFKFVLDGSGFICVDYHTSQFLMLSLVLSIRFVS